MSRASILLIQFRQKETTATMEFQSISRELGDAVKLTSISALDTELSWTKSEKIVAGYDGIIFGGSGDFDFDGARAHDDPARAMSYVLLEQLRPLITYIFAQDIPTLGICYGHQLIGAFHGVAVAHDVVQRKTRSHQVQVLADAHQYFLCSNLPATFKAQYGHKDVLQQIPAGATLIIQGGEACQISALCYSENIFSTQFHPELNLEDMQKRVEATPGYLPEGVQVEELFEEALDAHLILKNFGELVERRFLKV